MNEKSIRALLPKDLEGREELAAQIYAIFNNAIMTEQAKAAAIQTKLDAALEAQKEAEEAMQAALADDSDSKELETLKAELETTKATLKAEQEAHTATKAGHVEKETNANIDKQVLAAVKDAKLHPSVIPLFEKIGYDRAKAKTDKDGKVTNLDEVVTAIKALPEFAPHFGGESHTEGAGAGNPPPNNNATLTRESVAKMSPDEINANWDAVQAVMKS